MTRIIAAIAGSALLVVVASSALADDDAALKAAAKSYVGHPVTQRVVDDAISVDMLRSFIELQLQMQGTQLRDDQAEALTRIIQEELQRMRPQLEGLLTTAVSETLTLEEIQAFNDFLNTELGASVMLKSNLLMQSFAADAGPLLNQMFERLGTRLESELPE